LRTKNAEDQATFHFGKNSVKCWRNNKKNFRSLSLANVGQTNERDSNRERERERRGGRHCQNKMSFSARRRSKFHLFSVKKKKCREKTK